MENSVDWRNQLRPDSRQKIVNRIMGTLEKHLPFSGPEGLNELRRIATRFEEKIYSGAVNQTDYLRKISMKMLSMEATSQTPSDYNTLPLDHGPAMNTGGDWRNQLPPDSRHKNVNKLLETVKKHVPYSGQDGIDELLRIAISFEDLIFNTAVNQVDYFRKISLKMETIEGGH